MRAPDRGILVIISSPSGAGKTTLAHRLLAEFPAVEFSVSFTTRRARPGEVDGKDYWFVDDATFDAMVDRGEFVEWAFVHGNRYGTARSAVERALVAGRDVVFDVDFQGGRALHEQFPADALMIFILPPDLATLADRLRRRATDAPEVIERRLQRAIEELEHHREYDWRIVNRELETAYQELRAIYLCERHGPACPPEAASAVERNRQAGGEAHAERLIEEGRAHLTRD